MFTMTLSSNFFHLILSPPHLKINVLLDVLFGAGDFPYILKLLWGCLRPRLMKLRIRMQGF